jgi:hypothetical protein
MIDSTIPIPNLMSGMPKDEDGYPIPVVIQGNVARPDYGAIDFAKFSQIIREKRCGICGGELGILMCFIGGPDSLHSRRFSDAAMHQACANYAVRVCPFIAMSATAYAIMKKHSQNTKRPEELYLYTSKGYRIDGVKDQINLVSAEFITHRLIEAHG